MENQSRDNLKELLKKISSLDYVHPDDIPNIDLYMDQVLTFLNQQLGEVQSASDEKGITKTMINNYTKNQLLPPPEKKKYSKDHMLDLIFIYYLKNFLPMKDIKTILDPINDKYFGSKDQIDYNKIYNEIVSKESTVAAELVKDTIKKYNLSREAFSDLPEEDRKTLQDFSFICFLSFDVFLKKMMIEQFISDKETSDLNDKEKEPEN